MRLIVKKKIIVNMVSNDPITLPILWSLHEHRHSNEIRFLVIYLWSMMIYCRESLSVKYQPDHSSCKKQNLSFIVNTASPSRENTPMWDTKRSYLWDREGRSTSIIVTNAIKKCSVCMPRRRSPWGTPKSTNEKSTVNRVISKKSIDNSHWSCHSLSVYSRNVRP